MPIPSVKFQSTRPVWGATAGAAQQAAGTPISIHAPRVGRDTMTLCSHELLLRFQSTRPVWGATEPGGRTAHADAISIHAPRVGRDIFKISAKICTGRFQSTRPVWGATTTVTASTRPSWKFQSTRPVWGATRPVPAAGSAHRISIHAPRVGRDSKFDDFTPSNLHKRYKRVLARPKNTREKGKIKQKLAYIHAFSAFLGCEGSGTFCALVLRTQYR